VAPEDEYLVANVTRGFGEESSTSSDSGHT